MTLKRLSILFVCFFLLFLLIKLPFALLAPNHKQTQFKGTIWNGAANNIATPFGPALLSFNADPTSLLMLSASGKWNVRSYGMQANGSANISLFSNPSLSDSVVDINLSTLNLEEAIIGSLIINIDHLELSDSGECIALTGSGRTDALIRSQDALKWQGPLLEGPIECLDGNFLITLKGEKGEDTVQILSTLYNNGLYQHEITISSENTILGLALTYQGFSQDGSGYILQRNGRWR